MLQLDKNKYRGDHDRCPPKALRVNVQNILAYFKKYLSFPDCCHGPNRDNDSLVFGHEMVRDRPGLHRRDPFRNAENVRQFDYTVSILNRIPAF